VRYPNRIVARVNPDYANVASADCDPKPTPQLVATTVSAQFLAAAPCGPDGQPLEPGAGAGAASTPGSGQQERH